MLSSNVSLVEGKCVKAVANVLEDDPLKCIINLYEMKKSDLVAKVSSKCKFLKLSSTEMKALSWVLKHDTCPITDLE